MSLKSNNKQLFSQTSSCRSERRKKGGKKKIKGTLFFKRQAREGGIKRGMYVQELEIEQNEERRRFLPVLK